MNDWQRTALATTAAALFLATVFIVPWRVEATGEIRWSPVFRSPIAFVPTYSQARPGSRFEAPPAAIAHGIWGLTVGAIVLAGGGAYWLIADSDEPEDDPHAMA